MKKACAPDGSVPVIVMMVPLAVAGDDPAYRQAGARVGGGCLVDGRGDVAGELGEGGSAGPVW